MEYKYNLQGKFNDKWEAIYSFGLRYESEKRIEDQKKLNPNYSDWRVVKNKKYKAKG